MVKLANRRYTYPVAASVSILDVKFNQLMMEVKKITIDALWSVVVGKRKGECQGVRNKNDG